MRLELSKWDTEMGGKSLLLTFYLYYIDIKTPDKTNMIKYEKMRKKWDL